MGNVPEIDLHVLEVGHLVIEIVIDYVFGHVAVPFTGVGDGGVEMDLEVQDADLWGSGVAAVGKFVAYDCQANAMCFSLGHLNVADEVGLGFF